MARNEIDIFKIQELIDSLAAHNAIVSLESDNVSIILEKLNELRDESPIAKEFADFAAEDLRVKKLREALATVFQNEGNTLAYSQAFYAHLLEIQLYVTNIWPLNAEGEEKDGVMTYRDPLDPEECFLLNADDIVAIPSAGYLFHKEKLNQYFSDNPAYVFINRVPYVCDPFGKVLSEREIAHLRNNGISISMAKNGLSFLNRIFNLSGQRQQYIAAEEQGFSVTLPTLRGAFTGSLLGTVAGVTISLALMYFAFPLSGLVMASVIATSILSGAIRGLYNHSGWDFLTDASSAAMTNLMLIGLVSLIATPLAGFLASNGWVMTSVLDTVMTKMPFILAAIPVVTIALGSMVELFQRDGVSRFYNALVRLPSQIALIVSEGLFATLAGVTARFFLQPIVLPKPKVESKKQDDKNAEEDDDETVELHPEELDNEKNTTNSAAQIFKQFGMDEEDLSDAINKKEEEPDSNFITDKSFTLSHTQFEGGGNGNLDWSGLNLDDPLNLNDDAFEVTAVIKKPVIKPGRRGQVGIEY